MRSVSLQKLMSNKDYPALDIQIIEYGFIGMVAVFSKSMKLLCKGRTFNLAYSLNHYEQFALFFSVN